LKKGIAVGGNIVVDYVKTIDSYPKQGNLSTIFTVSKAVGGALPNVLLDLAKMDSSIPLQAIGLVGNDEDGEQIIRNLKQYNINTELVKQDANIGTSFSDVMTVKSTGARTFFHYRGTNRLLDMEHFDFEKIEADLLHIGYALLLDSLDASDPEYGVVMARLLDKAQKSGLKTSLDVVSENSDRYSRIVPPSLKYCNYFIVNEVEASLTAGIPLRDEKDILLVENMPDVCSRLMDMGVNDLVVIHAPEGGYAMDRSRKYYQQESLKLPDGYIKGTVGAGDAFCAGILYSLYKEWDVNRALQTASAAAACCLSEMNATDGMRDIAGIEELYDTMSRTSQSI
jgi:sugar/nucleoside kinase (ribokinase family)